MLTGSGECARVNWSFLGLAMPTWVLLCALALGALGLRANLRRSSRLSDSATYIRCSASMSASRTHSLTLWIVALMTPSSTTCAPERRDEAAIRGAAAGGALRRRMPVTSCTAALTASDKVPGGV